MSVDVIGDIHGHAEALEALLGALGYVERRGAWRHPARTAIFVGDLIDRGPGQLSTLELVRAMLDAGSAEAVMGNHEFNAIGWAAADARSPGRHLRPRHGDKGAKNARQHAAFLTAVGADGAEHDRWIEWFLDLPLWIERDDLRVVHACWDPASAATLAPRLRPGRRLDAALVVAAHRRDDPAFSAVDVLLKGPEAEMPDGASFTDKDGHVRTAIRTRWWDPDLATFAAAYIGPDGVDIPDVALPVRDRIPAVDRATFIGHYWLNLAEAAKPLTPHVACVDYSVAKGGPLVAYRFDGEPELSAAKFVCVGLRRAPDPARAVSDMSRM